MKKIVIIFLAIVMSFTIVAQVNFSANDQVTPYDGAFISGVNFDYYPPFTPIDLANLTAGNPSLNLSGVGAKTTRPALCEKFTEDWGIDFLVPDFQHFQNLGMNDLTLIVGFPSEWHRDHQVYCSDGVTQSQMFANLYTPIWDGGANGTPYNDDNYLAAYIYKLVTLYKDNVKFWEIWDNPGFDHSYIQGWQPPGGPDNWWDNNPSPCVTRIHAPIQHFIKTMRICYDVIKTVDPDAYVMLSNVNHESFLDAILRNTDNPFDGSVTSEYPLKGGAYFDFMSFTSYPDIDGSVREWDANLNQWNYHRNSDKAANGIAKTKNKYQNRLAAYGYDGITYPKKEWIITEFNAPRKAFSSNTMASNESQINYITKSLVIAQRNDIRQAHVYKLADIKPENQANGEFDLLGLYKSITNTQPYGNVTKTDEGIALTTCNHFLEGTKYDAAQSAAMALPSNIDGAAFFDEANQRYKYIIWAKTNLDLSENASATYSFPASFNLSSLSKIEWDYSETNSTSTISASNFPLSGRPIYLTAPANPSNPLTIICPSNQTIVGTTTDVTLQWPLPTATTNCTSDSLFFTQTSGTPLGTTLNQNLSEIIMYEVSDSCGNMASCQFTIEASLQTPLLTLTCPSPVTISLSQGQTDTILSWNENDIIVNTNCGTTAVTQISGPDNGGTFSVGIYNIKYLGISVDCPDTTVTATCYMTIFVFGNPNPTLSVNCPSDTVILGSTTEVVLDWDLPTATTSCSTDSVTINQFLGPAPGTTFNTFINALIGYSISDSCGDYTNCYINVTGQLVIDTPMLVLVCPSDTTIEVEAGLSGEIFNWSPDDLAIITNCGAPKILQTEGLSSGSTFPIGETKINQIGVSFYNHYNTVVDECSFTVKIKEVSSNNNPILFRQFDVSPNPSFDIVNIDIQAHPSQQIEIMLINQMGQILLSEKYPFKSGHLQTTLDLSKIPSAAYLIQAKTDNQMTIKKIVH